MNKVLLVIFTLCGQPMFVVGQDTESTVVGELREAPPEALEVIKGIMTIPDALVLERRLEGLTGVRCS